MEPSFEHRHLPPAAFLLASSEVLLDVRAPLLGVLVQEATTELSLHRQLELTAIEVGLASIAMRVDKLQLDLKRAARVGDVSARIKDKKTRMEWSIQLTNQRAFPMQRPSPDLIEP